MSTDDHDQTHTNGLEGDAEIAAEDHTCPHEPSHMFADQETYPPSSIPPHSEDHTSEDDVDNHSTVDTAVHPIPRTALLHAETKPELDYENAIDTKESEHDGESEGIDDEKEDEGEGDEDEDGEEDEEGEDDEEDEDEEPALKYERLGGAFQDLLKKDSASALAVSNKFLVRGGALA